MRRRWPRWQEKSGPHQQIQSMGDHFPGFHYKATRNGGLVWNGELQPTPESPRYRVRIDHEGGDAPAVWVEKPDLPKDAPHRYPSGKLCLYWPEEWSWRDEETLAETIVPWAALWLYYYEVWQVTGEWLGPEAPHGGEDKKQE